MWEYQLIQHIDKSLLLFSCSVTSDSATPWTVAHQAPLSMGFPRQEYWSGLPFPSPEDLPDLGSNPHLLHFGQSPALQVDSLPPCHLESPIFNSLETKRFENYWLKPNQDSPSGIRGLSSLPGGMRLLDFRGALKPSRFCEETGVSVRK